MRQSFRLVPQEDKNGCGIACVASILGMDYGVVRDLLGRPSGMLSGSKLHKLVEKRKKGKKVRYRRRLWKSVEKGDIKVGTLAMVRADNHFIVWTNKGWMDSWSNKWHWPPKASYRCKPARTITTVWIPCRRGE